MNFYFELSENLENIRYFAVYNVEEKTIINSRYRSMMWNARRVWAEDNKHIFFLKNRINDVATVDLKELFWIKLQCQS